MARKGRKRKWRGQKLPYTKEAAAIERAPDDRIRASLQPHRRGLCEGDRLSERAESPLGRLNLNGIITDEQHEAGLRYAVIVGSYRAVIGAPRSTSGAGRGLECDHLCRAAHELLSAEQRLSVRDGLFDIDTCPCLGRKWRYDQAFESLMKAGQRAAKAVARVAVWREEITAGDVEHLRAGLINLAREFGLTARKKQNSIRNIQYAIAPAG